jgi:AcrR family transcriptional regulator
MNDSTHLRADAQQNYDRLLEVAARALARDGGHASLKAIAQEAGVGIGTLYRRFPSREVLVEAVYRSESRRLCDSAPDLLRELPPVDALRTWMLRFLDYMATKHGMADALHMLLTADEGLRLATRSMIYEALTILLQACKDSGQLRAGLNPTDVSLALGGFALIVDDQYVEGLGPRLVDLLLEGLIQLRTQDVD